MLHYCPSLVICVGQELAVLGSTATPHQRNYLPLAMTGSRQKAEVHAKHELQIFFRKMWNDTGNSQCMLRRWALFKGGHFFYSVLPKAVKLHDFMPRIEIARIRMRVAGSCTG